MIGSLITGALSGLGRKAALWGALAGAVLMGVYVLIRYGKEQAEADMAIRAADARVRAMQASKGIRHEVRNADRADLDDRADRWMRD